MGQGRAGQGRVRPLKQEKGAEALSRTISYQLIESNSRAAVESLSLRSRYSLKKNRKTKKYLAHHRRWWPAAWHKCESGDCHLESIYHTFDIFYNAIKMRFSLVFLLLFHHLLPAFVCAFCCLMGTREQKDEEEVSVVWTTFWPHCWSPLWINTDGQGFSGCRRR